MTVFAYKRSHLKLFKLFKTYLLIILRNSGPQSVPDNFEDSLVSVTGEYFSAPPKLFIKDDSYLDIPDLCEQCKVYVTYV